MKELNKSHSFAFLDENSHLMHALMPIDLFCGFIAGVTIIHLSILKSIIL